MLSMLRNYLCLQQATKNTIYSECTLIKGATVLANMKTQKDLI